MRLTIAQTYEKFHELEQVLGVSEVAAYVYLTDKYYSIQGLNGNGSVDLVPEPLNGAPSIQLERFQEPLDTEFFLRFREDESEE